MPFLNLLFGLGIFLFGMLQLERSMQTLGSNWFKQWLNRSTATPVSSVLSGTVITAVLQSSSMVSLLVLAFASAGMIPLYNAIGVLLGANLGTTFTGWIVTTVGFKLNLSAIAIPAIGCGCLLQVFVEKSARARAIGALLLGFGLLLFGLDFMKSSVEYLPNRLNMESLQGFTAIQFLLIGCVLSAVIQSSSASMMLALTALHTGIIELQAAAALIIGADLGTTSTTILASFKGSPIKRQLAMSHVMFNVIVDALAFVFLLPALPFMMQVLGLNDPLYSLVAFHSLFNFTGLLLFTPLLRPYANWIGKLFQSNKTQVLKLTEVAANTSEAAVTACEYHCYRMLMAGIGINLRNLKIDPHQLAISNSIKEILEGSDDSQTFEQRYEQLKHAEGELIQYVSDIQKFALTEQQSTGLLKITECSRLLVYAVKTLKDIRSDLMQLRHSNDELLQRLEKTYLEAMRNFYQRIISLLDGMHEPAYVQEQLETLINANNELEHEFNQSLEPLQKKLTLDANQLSTLLNVNRAIYNSGVNLLQGIKRWYEI